MIRPAPLELLHRGALAHLGKLGPERIRAWLRRHGLLALPAPSPEVKAALGRARRRTLAANLHHVACFQEAVDALAAEGIPVCPLKGIHLLATAYAADPENRPMGDLDLLVPEEALEAAVARLERALDLRETASSRRLAAESHERVLTRPGLVVELHRDLGLRTARPAGWGHLEPAPGWLHDREVDLLDRETVLVHALAHFVRHGPWTRLMWVEDLLRLGEAGYDPAVVAARARELGVRRRTAAAVRVLRAALGPETLPGLSSGAGLRGVLPLRLYARLAGAHRGRAVLRGREGSRCLRNLGTALVAEGPRDLWRLVSGKVGERLRRDVSRKAPVATSRVGPP